MTTPEPNLPTPDPNPAPAPEPKPAPTPDPSPTPDPAAAKLADAENRLKALEKELNGYRKEKQTREDAEKSAAEKLADREKEIAALKRQTLIDRVRRDGGFTAKVFDAVSVSGDDEDAIKSAFEAFKTGLDDYAKNTVKAAPGGGTGDAKDPAKDKKTGTDTRPYLVRKGLISEKKAV